MLMLKSTHDRIVAAAIADKDAHNEHLVVTLQHVEDLNRRYARKVLQMADHLQTADETIARLEARLAVFTAPRKRNAKGHFLPVKSPIDKMIDALEAM